MGSFLQTGLMTGMLLLVNMDRPPWFGAPKDKDANPRTTSRPLVTQVEGCELEPVAFAGPGFLKDDWTWYWTCGEHAKGLTIRHRLMDVRAEERLLKQWHALSLKESGPSGQESLKYRREDRLSMALVLATLCLQQGKYQTALPYLRYLSEHVSTWPEELQGHGPALEWLGLRYACQRKNAMPHTRDSELHSLLQNHGSPVFSSKQWDHGILWHYSLSFRRYLWAVQSKKPMDALAYYRESQFYHGEIKTAQVLHDHRVLRGDNRAGTGRSSLWTWLGILGLLTTGALTWWWFRKPQVVSLAGTGLGLSTGPMLFQAQDQSTTVHETVPIQANLTGWSELRNRTLYTDEDWDRFKVDFDRYLPGFVPGLLVKYPKITQAEIRLACLIRLGLNSRDAVRIQNISPSGVAMARYRLRKRLNLGPQDSMEQTLMNRGGSVLSHDRSEAAGTTEPRISGLMEVPVEE